ncbi:orc1/cdc6 family replication initiation protein [Thermoplasmatales archaeon SCGC AB-540-F20]|nr:orc1/cdc6 family replication initiation protein [Thermoplasmatales archaeon SCGC AB-540-F20]
MSDIIEDELFSSSVIKDLHALDFDYVPEELPHRTEQLRRLARMFKPLLNDVSQNAVVRGPVGTGKTVVAKKFCNSFVNIARKQGKIIEYAHINCRKRSTDAMVLIGILNHFDQRFPDRGFSVQEMLQILHKQLKRRDAQLLLVLDEADALLKKSGSNLVYNLTRFTDETMKTDNPLSIIMVSQKDVLSDLDSSALSTFKRSNTIILDKYVRDELYDIVDQRVGLAFHNHTVSLDSIDLIADIASEWGDARFAIELLWKAGMCVDQQHVQLVVPEHVRAAKAETYSVVTETKLKNLEKHQLLTLLSIAKRLHRDDAAYANTGDVEKTYAITCEEYNEKPRAHTMFWSYLKEVENAGFIHIKLSGKGQLGTTQLISLPDIPVEILVDKLEGFLR